MRKSVMMILVCVLVLSACGPSFKGAVRKSVAPAPDFTLNDQNGQPFRLSEQRGRVVFLFFGYSYCPDECPLTLSAFKQAQRLLGGDAANVRFVLVTVDPERDSPARLKEYLNVFSADFVGLTGTPVDLGQVYQSYGVYVKKTPPEEGATGYSIDHTVGIYVIDRAGQWRLLEDYTAAPEDMVNDARILLKS
jgi:protein SCO1